MRCWDTMVIWEKTAMRDKIVICKKKEVEADETVIWEANDDVA